MKHGSRSAEGGDVADLHVGDIEIRDLRTHAELAACVELQREIWGEHFSERVPATILMVAQRVGGVAAGAFDARGRLLGFVFGLSGIEHGRLVHWSDMLAVRPAARRLGLGRRLKEFQRDTLRARGVERIYWTFDPLVARNAYFNIVRLGVEVMEYARDMYGETGSELHRGVGTDRLIVRWNIAPGSRANAALGPVTREQSTAPLFGDGAKRTGLLSSPVLRIAVPLDIEAIQRASLEDAARWRERTRDAFQASFAEGFQVSSFSLDESAGRGYYILSRGDLAPDES